MFRRLRAAPKQVFPIWCVAPLESGGLGLDSSNIGAVMAVAGVALVAFQFGIYPKLARKPHARRVMSCCGWQGAPAHANA
eukprot:662508-Pleurochrysis_carterae.AAC.2